MNWSIMLAWSTLNQNNLEPLTWKQSWESKGKKSQNRIWKANNDEKKKIKVFQDEVVIQLGLIALEQSK